MYHGRMVEGSPIGEYEDVLAWIDATFGPLMHEEPMLTVETFFADHTDVEHKTADGKLKLQIIELIAVEDVKCEGEQ